MKQWQQQYAATALKHRNAKRQQSSASASMQTQHTEEEKRSTAADVSDISMHTNTD